MGHVVMYLYSCSGANSNRWCRLDGSCSDALAGSEPVMNDDDWKEPRKKCQVDVEGAHVTNNDRTAPPAQ